jgi:putative ABC transport system permease protein
MSDSNPLWHRYLRFWSSDARADLDDELAFHVQSRVDEYAALGMETDAARAEAARRMGDLAPVRTECLRIDRQSTRKQSMSNVAHGVATDLRVALRQLRRQRGFAVTVIACLALGIGANTAIFSVVDAVLFRPLPFRDPSQLVLVGEGLPMISNQNLGQISAPDYLDFAALDGSAFQSSAAFEPTSVTLSGRGTPEIAPGLAASHSLFDVLGVHPALGRSFLATEDSVGAPDVVMLSDALWRRRFGANRAIIGQSIVIDGRPTTVVGVMPRGFSFPWTGLGIDPAQIFVPFRMTPAVMQDRGNSYDAYMIARLAPGTTTRRAGTMVNAIAARMPAMYPDVYHHSSFRIVADALPLRDQLVGGIRRSLLLLLGAVGVVLLVACINVASLLLAQAARRSREIAVRTALGANQRRLAQQFLAESSVLVALGVAGALLITFLCTRVLAVLAPEGLLTGYHIGIDLRVLAFTLGIAVLVVFAFSLVSVLHSSERRLPEQLGDEGRGTTIGRTRQRGRRALVVSEIALALVLAAGAGLLLRSFAKTLRVDPGFAADRLLSFEVALPSYHYPSSARVIETERHLLEQLSLMPGAKHASAAVTMPMRGDFRITFTPEGTSMRTAPTAVNFIVMPHYFETMGIQVIQGRSFDVRDDSSSPPVVIVNEKLAKQFFPRENPIGHRLKWGTAQSGDPWTTIVGVVSSVKAHSLDEEDTPEIYFPALQLARDSTFVDGTLRGLNYVIQADGDHPLDLANAARRIVTTIDRGLPVTNIESGESLIAQSVASRRFNVLLFGAFAVLALLLAAVGIYGLIAYSVTQRQREIGVRMALGATSASVVWLVLREGLWTTVAGTLLGLAGAVALTRLMRSLLFEVSGLDAVTFATATGLLIVVALVASWLPARRAAQVHPVVAIRAE